jgi:hypothetical protein
MLGETYEYQDPHGNFKMIAELTVHHPPIIAYHVEGTSGYVRYSTLRPKPQFVKGSIQVKNQNKDYIELRPHNERYEFQSPGIQIKNIIIGTPYLDIVGKCYVKSVTRPELQAKIEFHPRGWSEKTYFRMNAEITGASGQVEYRIEGRWSESAVLINAKTGQRGVIWEKKPYPENW